MKCKNGHENPEESTFCQECGVKLQSAEEQPQDVKGGQETLRKEYSTQPQQPLAGSDVGRFLKRVSPVQWVVAGAAAIAIVVAIGIGASASGSSSPSTDTSPAEPAPTSTVIPRTYDVDWLQNQLTGTMPSSGFKWDSGTIASAASCADVNVDSDGAGSYLCHITFITGSVNVMTVAVGTNGNIIAGG